MKLVYLGVCRSMQKRMVYLFCSLPDMRWCAYRENETMELVHV